MEISFKNMSLLVILAILKSYVVKADICGNSSCVGTCCYSENVWQCCANTTDVTNTWWFVLLMALLFISAFLVFMLIGIRINRNRRRARMQELYNCIPTEQHVTIHNTVVTSPVEPPPAYGAVDPNAPSHPATAPTYGTVNPNAQAYQ